MKLTQVKDLMEEDLELISPSASLQEAANKMKNVGCGFLPVGDGESPEGIITDRDIVIRAVAEGKDPAKEQVRDYMTREICACAETDTLEEAAKAMSVHNVSRLIVQKSDGTLCGVLTFGRIIRSNNDSKETQKVVDHATGKAA